MNAFSITLGAFSISAPTKKDLHAILADEELMQKASERAEALGLLFTPSAQASAPSVRDGDGPFVQAFKAQTGKRFRMTTEESALWGDDREAACKARMEKQGLTLPSEQAPSEQSAKRQAPAIDTEDLADDD